MLGLRLCGLLPFAMMCPRPDDRAALVLALLRAGASGNAWAMQRSSRDSPHVFSCLVSAIVSSFAQGCAVDLAGAMLREAVARGADPNTTDSQGIGPLAFLVNHGINAPSAAEAERTAEFIGVMVAAGVNPDLPEAMPQVTHSHTHTQAAPI